MMAIAYKNVAITLENWIVAAVPVDRTGLRKLAAELIAARVVLDAGILLQLS